jgi:hypothetical protein
VRDPDLSTALHRRTLPFLKTSLGGNLILAIAAVPRQRQPGDGCGQSRLACGSRLRGLAPRICRLSGPRADLVLAAARYPTLRHHRADSGRRAPPPLCDAHPHAIPLHVARR